MNQERLLQVLIAPHVSEKSANVGERNNQYVFRVATDATKPEIKSAVEQLFSVSVSAVQVLSLIHI
jgi:large subunit ribosomal protein L23